MEVNKNTTSVKLPFCRQQESDPLHISWKNSATVTQSIAAISHGFLKTSIIWSWEGLITQDNRCLVYLLQSKQNGEHIIKMQTVQD